MTVATETTVDAFLAGKVGVYENIRADVYHSLDACSASRLKDMRQSPAHCRHAMDNPKSSPSMLVGEAAHCLRLERSAFRERFRSAEQCEATTGKGKTCSRMGSLLSGGQWFCSQHADESAEPDPVKVLTVDQLVAVNGIASASRHHPAASSLLDADGPVELSLLWIDHDTGILCKCRVDKLARRWRTLVDLKTTTDASPAEFPKAVWNFGYAIQAAHYLAGAEALRLEADIFAFVAVESAAPYGVGVYQLAEEAVASGHRQRQALIARYAECKASGVWPCYSDEPQIISLPRWAAAEEF